MRSLLICAFVLTSSAAFARPPPGATGQFSVWFRSLKIPGTSLSCYSKADCRAVPFRTHDGHYEAFIGKARFTDGPNEWVVVPESKIIRDKPNPTGSAQACWTRWGNVLCFVLPSMT